MTVTQQALSLKDAAEVLGVHSETLRRIIKKGHLKASKVAGVFRISKHDLQEYWLNQGGGRLFEDYQNGGGNDGEKG